MRKIFFTLVLSMVVITASFHAQVKRYVIKESKTNKTINIAVAPSDGYHLKEYANCEAKLDYTVIKIRGGVVDTIVQKQLPKFKLKDLSLFAKAFNENIEVKDVAFKKEKLVVGYTITYLSNGSVLKVAHETLIPKQGAIDSLTINI
jgi:hypothetical protein